MRALFMVTVAGSNITSTLSPVLTSISVSSKVGTHSDTATLELDDSDGRISMPTIGAPVTVALGWDGQGARIVFTGTVDEIKSTGSRSGGRTLSITAKGMDTTKKPKEAQQRHFDQKTIKEILTEAGKPAGIDEVEVDPSLASITRRYFDMRDESFIHAGERLAREIGGNFRVNGNKATMSKRGGIYKAAINAAWGDNLHSWEMAPSLGRTQFSKARSRWYDKEKAEWRDNEQDTNLQVDARHVHRYAKADEGEADQQVASDKATSERDSGEGSITIEGNTAAIPDGLCVIVGARSGVDGSYRIESVTHQYSRSSGFTTQLSLKNAGGG